MNGSDPISAARDIAERTILEGARERGAVGTSDDGLVEVRVAKNGDLLRVVLDSRVSSGVDPHQLERSIIQGYRRANRQLFNETLDGLAHDTDAIPPASMYEAVAERFREPR